MVGKRKIVIIFLMISLLIVFKILEYHHLFPGQEKRRLQLDGVSVTTLPEREEGAKSSKLSLPAREEGAESSKLLAPAQEEGAESSKSLSSDTGESTPEEPKRLSPKANSLTGESSPQEKHQAAKPDNNSEQTSQTIATAATAGKEEAKMFSITELNKEIKDRITGISYADNCTVPYEELRYVQVLHWGFDGETHTGELIVGKAIAEDIVDIFKELYAAGYPIERMVLIDDYQAQDNASMAANNSSAFCYRVIDNGSNKLSNHSFGLAIDINPLYNPYVREIDGKTVVSPEEGAKYADRTLDCSYYIQKGDVCYQAFVSRGFTWGGDWKSQKDYQHFQKVLDE